MFDILSILLAKTAYALLYAWLCLSLLLSEAFTPLIGASNPIVWAIGSAFVVARLILYLLQVFMKDWPQEIDPELYRETQSLIKLCGLGVTMKPIRQEQS